MHEEYCRRLAFGMHNSFSQSFPFLYLSLIFMTHPSWVVCCFVASNCSYTALSTIVLVSSSSSNNRHSMFRWDCSFCSFSLRLPSPLRSFHNLEPSKLEGCWLALRRCVELLTRIFSFYIYLWLNIRVFKYKFNIIIIKKG